MKNYIMEGLKKEILIDITKYRSKVGTLLNNNEFISNYRQGYINEIHDLYKTLISLEKYIGKKP